MTPEQKAERLEQIKNDPSALESYLDTADELSVALVEELTLNRKQRKEIKALQEEHAVWEKHSLCKLAAENARLREALEWISKGPTHGPGRANFGCASTYASRKGQACAGR